MKYKFIDTNTKLNINGHEFTLDIGEIEVGVKASALFDLCFKEKLEGIELIAQIRETLDDLLGQGSSDKLLENISATNEIQIRRLAMGVSAGINKKRAEMVLSALTPEKIEIPEAKEEARVD